MKYAEAMTLVACLALFAGGATTGCKRNNAASGQTAQSTQEKEDTAVVTRVQAKFYAEPSIRNSDITVASRDGVVTLNGKVPSEDVKQRAVNVARGVQGVTNVQDHLGVQQASSSPAPTSGQSGQGQPTAATPGATGQTATAGSASSGPSPSQLQQSGVEQQLRDGALTVKVQSEFFADPTVKGRRIDVDTANGVVTLAGRVDNQQEHDRAIQIARGTTGVKDVQDELQIASPADRPAATSGSATPAPATGDAAAKPSDDEITTHIQSKFFSDDSLRPTNIDVKTADGVVTLGGTVATPGQRDRAVAVADATTGVQRVDDQMRVVTPQPSVGTVGQLPAGQQAASQVPDEELAARVQSEYFLNDAVKKSDIAVSARSGVVTLTGTVDSPEAKRQAESTAKSIDGVSRVIDNITVKNSTSGGR